MVIWIVKGFRFLLKWFCLEICLGKKKSLCCKSVHAVRKGFSKRKTKETFQVLDLTIVPPRVQGCSWFQCKPLQIVFFSLNLGVESFSSPVTCRSFNPVVDLYLWMANLFPRTCVPLPSVIPVLQLMSTSVTLTWSSLNSYWLREIWCWPIGRDCEKLVMKADWPTSLLHVWGGRKASALTLSHSLCFCVWWEAGGLCNPYSRF